MVQCAGSRDRRRLPHCSRLCCMIALKHAIRLKTLFPAMKVTICYLEMRTAGVGYENWFLDARKAGVEFLRGTPAEVQFDAAGRPVIEVEDVTAARKRVLRPDLVVLSTGMVPAAETERIAQTLGVERDEDGFIEILDRKNRATETSGEGIFVCGSAAGPKALIEVNTEASAVASEIHNFLTSSGRRGTAASQVDAAQCVGCDTCMTLCPFAAVTPAVERPADAPRPAEVKDDGKLAVIDPQTCRACGICAANCPEVAIAHNLSDDALFGRIALMTAGRREAGRRLLLQRVRRRRHRPERSAARPVPRERAPHRAAVPGQGQRPAHRGGGPPGRSRGVPGRLRRRPLPVPHRRHERPGAAADRRGPARRGGHDYPLELWHLCAVDRLSVGRRIRLFQARAAGDELSLDRLERSWSSSARRPPRRAGEVSAVAPRLTRARYPTVVREEFARLAQECAACYQCGTCTSACPSGHELYRGPAALVRLVLAGDIDAVIKSDDLWRCTECGSCTERCRMEIDVAAVLSACGSLNASTAPPSAARSAPRPTSPPRA